GLEELVRVSGRYVALTLPNMAHFLFRARFLVKGRLSGKYDLAYDGGRDRHRWVTVLPQTRDYLAKFCADRGFMLESLDLGYNGRRIGPVERAMATARLPAAWHVWVTV